VGGAYGGFSDFDSHSGMYTYLSYRDPNVLKTIESYDGTPDFLRNLDLDRDSLTKAIIGTIGDIDSYQLPDSKVQMPSAPCCGQSLPSPRLASPA
jgi:presequence protease